jgi:hypothetical protein
VSFAFNYPFVLSLSKHPLSFILLPLAFSHELFSFTPFALGFTAVHAWPVKA